MQQLGLFGFSLLLIHLLLGWVQIIGVYYENIVVVFPQAPFRVTNVPGQASAGIIQLRNCTMAFLRMAVGDLVTPFVLESCLIIHVLLNLQIHTWGMSLASSGKFV